MIRFDNVSVIMGRGVQQTVVVRNLDLTLEEGKISCILGPSGSGKTTLLNAIANLQSVSSGNLTIDGFPVHDSTKSVGYVFQGHNLFPWKTVRENIGFGLSATSYSIEKKKELVEDIAREIGMYDKLENYPSSLSGGMKQRVGLARALVAHPSVILMDEPFASLDALTAIKLRQTLVRLANKHKSTVVFVTHNIEEAIELGDRVIVVSHTPMKVLVDRRRSAGKAGAMKYENDLRIRIYEALGLNIKEE